LLLSGEGHAPDQRIGKQLDQERMLFEVPIAGPLPEELNLFP
jgi:hypothetical protein